MLAVWVSVCGAFGAICCALCDPGSTLLAERLVLRSLVRGSDWCKAASSLHRQNNATWLTINCKHDDSWTSYS